ncbi:hypothetical protein [Algoriphagus sp. Y33]|uniref:hypothetical protein n=1 Tax=Algoriphagus sp. Y33 TaxID=2772483 RepID=UPI001CE1811C|nr:hypothetical protein [Algoriphagus sp. Y33]
MLENSMEKAIMITFALVIFIAQTQAQKVEEQNVFCLNDRVDITPDDIILNFQEMGMNPVNHVLTPTEQEVIEMAFDALPPLHQKILKEHLYSISFLDNMPNTALASPVGEPDENKMFTITFRSEILHQTISEWATWKENSLYIPDSDYQVVVDAGDLNALVYILLHEATHVLDAVLGISTQAIDADTLVIPSEFSRETWVSMNKPKEEFRKSILETTRFRGGGPIAMSLAAEVYQSLQETAFVSLYGMASWHEDLAELATIHHLTNILGQPYHILVIKKGKEIFRFEPMKSHEVQQRVHHLDLFYRN